MTEEQVEQLLNEISTAAVKFNIVYNGAKEQGGNLAYGLDDVLRPILRRNLLENVAQERYSDGEIRIRQTFVSKGFIEAIRLHRQLTGSYLKESKAYVENLCKGLESARY